MDYSPVQILREALEEHASPEAAAVALAEEPGRLTVHWRALLQDHETTRVDRYGDTLRGLEAL